MHLRLHYNTDFSSVKQLVLWTSQFSVDPSVLISEGIISVVPVELFSIEQGPSDAKYHRNINYHRIKLEMVT